jgi:tripartite-type tricarboxylate transporter receptor subunit TctC
MLLAMQRYTMPAFTDLLASHTAQALQGESDEPFAVVRKPRQGGKEASTFVGGAAADGRTLLLASSPAADSRARGLAPIATVATMPYVLIAGGDRSPAKLGELIDGTRSSGSRLLVGSAGERTAGHVAIDLLRSRAGLRLEPVAYNGGNAALNALVTKQVNVAIVPLPAVLPYIGGGRLSALVIAQSHRHARIPDVQTSDEAGLGELKAASSFAVFAPAAIRQATIRELRTNLARALEADAMRELFSDWGLESNAQRGITGTTSREGLLPPS